MDIDQAPDELLIKLRKDPRCPYKTSARIRYILVERGIGDLKEYKYK